MSICINHNVGKLCPHVRLGHRHPDVYLAGWYKIVIFQLFSFLILYWLESVKQWWLVTGYVCYDGPDGREKLTCIAIEQREAQGAPLVPLGCMNQAPEDRKLPGYLSTYIGTCILWTRVWVVDSIKRYLLRRCRIFNIVRQINITTIYWMAECSRVDTTSWMASTLHIWSVLRDKVSSILY